LGLGLGLGLRQRVSSAALERRGAGDVGEMWARYRGAIGELWGSYRGDLGEIWGRYMGDLGEIWGRCELRGAREEGRLRCGRDVGDGGNGGRHGGDMG
jgi:hypothetical protein